jgi:uncharacterized protein
VRSRNLIFAATVYAIMLAVLWIASRNSALAHALGTSFPRALVSFALLFAPLWFLGFGLTERLRQYSAELRVIAAVVLAIPYFVFAAGTGVFYWRTAAVVLAFPVLLSGFIGLPKLAPKMTWRDCAALAILTAAYFFHWFQASWPNPAMTLFPKVFLADVAAYCFLVAREIDGAGYCLLPSASAAWFGLREWLFYFPFAVAVGEATGFIRFNPAVPHAGTVAVTILVTLLLVALPEELFFRAILQNLLETRLGRTGALVTAALLFGLSHFNHGAVFNWRYVLLATIAGVFYGRAWRERRQIIAAIITHTAVDVVWVLWFR